MLEWNRFECVCVAPCHPLAVQARLMFNKIDVTGNGTISAQELQAKMASLPARSRGQWQAVMEEIDKDGSGDIGFDEFNSVVRL